MSFEISSNVSATLQKVYEAHWETGNEVNSKIGFDIKNGMEKALRSKTTNYTTNIVAGKRIIVKKDSTHAMGDRFSRSTGKKLPVNMGNFIQWRTYSTTGTTVVGGLMKAGTTEIRENGKVVRKTRVHGVHQDSIDILEKIDSGKTGKAKWVDGKTGKLSPISMPNFAGTHKPTNFISEGKRNAMSNINRHLNQGFKSALSRREKMINEKPTRVA